MKKYIYLSLVLFALTGCGMGINHNIATIDGQTYLIETGTRNLLLVGQWSEEPKYINITEEIKNRKEITNTLEALKRECEIQGYSDEDVYKCILEKSNL